MKNANTILIASTPYDTVRLWCAPKHGAALAKISIWGGVDARDPSLGTVSVEVDPGIVATLPSLFPGLVFTRDAQVAMEAWG